jgi:phenylalanyl-tRNA synthetase alpha chain
MAESLPSKTGVLHPMSSLIREITTIFKPLGYTIASGPELETEFYNFDALNVAKDHPSRDMQDTFWIKNKFSDGERRVLRTQTSAVQVRFMQTHTPPFAVIVPGKVYRNEATDATHEAQFFQLEGLYVAEKVSLADLKGTLTHLYKKLFGDDVEIRFRPSYFPFVEPAFEVDMKWGDRWLEICGAGLVHPNVFTAAGLDSTKWQGFAFGGGLDRLLMLKYGITDIRELYQGDLRFIRQFNGETK